MENTSKNPFALKGMNPWVLLSFALVGFIAGYAISEANQPKQPAAPSPTIAGRMPTTMPMPPTPSAPPSVAANPASVDDDPVLGDDDATVTLIEFTDYQCPYCGRFFSQTLPQIKSEYIETGKIKYVMRDFPLSFHQNAQKSAEASECADDQGKFWEYHDTLFQNQQQLDVASLKRYAGDIGLDQTTFDSCFDGGKNAQEVQKDMADGSASGISGTPGFWIIGPDGKGQQLSGAQPFTSFKAVIDTML